MKKFKIITLCGSTKFKDEFIEIQKKLTLDKNIVISVGLFGHSGDEEAFDEETKEMLDEMHKRKIDLADEIFVINKNGYIGNSTKNEIEYAKEKGKLIKYLENENIDDILYKYKGKKILISEDIKQNSRQLAIRKTNESKNAPTYVDKSEEKIFNSFYQGFLGEFAIQEMFGNILDLEHYISGKYGDEGIDHISKKFKVNIDTKTTTGLNTYSQMVPISRIYSKTDMYFITNLEGNEIEFKGFLWKKDVVENFIKYQTNTVIIPGVKKEHIR